MHLHGPYICQYGVHLNYPPFSECDNMIKQMRSEFARIISIKEAVKLKYTKGRVSADKEDKTSEEAVVSVMPWSRGHFKIAKFIDRTNCIRWVGPK